MFALFFWVFVGAIFFGAARGTIQARGKKDSEAPVTWIVAVSLYIGLIVYFAPWEPGEPLDPAVKAQIEANELNMDTLRIAMSACDNRVISGAAIPNSVDFHILSTERNMIGDTAHINRTFTMKNAFGTEIEYRYRCRYRGGEIAAFSLLR